MLVAEVASFSWQGGGMSPVQIRPVGGSAGCLVMILISLALSVLLTVGLNLFLR